MPYEIVIPRLGLTMESGRVAEWYVAEGESVKKGEILFAIETDKALQEVEAPTDGIVHHRPDTLDVELPIGTLIGYIGQQDEAVSWPSHATPLSTEPDPVSKAASLNSPHVRAGDDALRASPAARRRAAEVGLDWREIVGSSREGHVLLSDVEGAAAESLRPGPGAERQISPVARRAAHELGVNLEALAARYPERRLTREDVLREAEAQREPHLVGECRPMDPVRRLIADRMSTSAHTTASVTLTSEVDATEMVHLRRQLKEDSKDSAKSVPAYSDILTKLVAEALIEHRDLNARLEGEEIVQSESMHIGLAVDTERGLIVPVMRDVQSKSLREVAIESADLSERARSGRIGPDEIQGSTFTITNLGMYDIDAFTPIINLTECAILGVGRIVPKQVVVDWQTERVAVRHMMVLSLTFDHRLVDGGPAARFLRRVKQYVEQPYLWLVT